MLKRLKNWFLYISIETTTIKLPDGANKPEFLIDDEGHIVLIYHTTEVCGSHSQRLLKFDDYIEIKCKND